MNESAARSFSPASKPTGRSYLLFILFLLTPLMGCSGDESSAELVELDLNGTIYKVELADTPEERARGLMHRKDLPEKGGMLFVFPYDERPSFWMKNTSIPLSLAYIAKDGTIKEIKPLVPYSEQPVPSSYSVRYALELTRGAFEAAGIGPGDRIGGLPLPD